MNELKPRKVRYGKISILISLSLVLFLVGMLAMVMINARKISNHVKENITISLFLSDSVTRADVVTLTKILQATGFVKDTRFVTREEAAKEFQKELGEDFVSFLGYNPLRESLDLRLQAEYANTDSLPLIEKFLSKQAVVKEVYYQRSLVNLVNDNVQKIGLFFGVLSGLLSIISIALINHSIRLYIYSKRFLIRTMQLVGATAGFIRKPFLKRAVVDALLGTLITWLMLGLVIWLLEQQIPELIELRDVDTFAILFAIVPLLGLSITVGSTYFAVRRYIKARTEQLYR